MEGIYPQGPALVPADLAKPSHSLRRHTWLATAMLVLFALLYGAITCWFGWTSWKMLQIGLAGADLSFLAYVGALGSGFFALFMLKGLWLGKAEQGESSTIEVTAAAEPLLFQFLYRLADEAGAPRPHRVFISARVNASVSYDLSLLNLVFPTRKNLEIGLALVNVLSLGELKAVLAHEFGHFAQRTMVVGRWAYIAQQIAARIIYKRDIMDRFLAEVSGVDIRVAIFGKALQLVVWSLRSLLETAFQLVVIAQRALSREMEMQADLVAVSLTGSDAVVSAMHRLAAADDAWERTVSFAEGEVGRSRLVEDLFAVQSRMIKWLRTILNDPGYGKPPVVPASEPAAFRVFKPELAQPSKMWATHPFNHEREENAKRRYVAAPVDERSAWLLFHDAAALRRQMSGHLVARKPDGAAVVPIADTLRALDQQFDYEYLKRNYGGAYLGRSVVRAAPDVAALYGPQPARALSALATLYPPSLRSDLDQLWQLEKEKLLLESVHEGRMSPPNGVICHRGQQLRRSQLARAIARVADECRALQARLTDHDRRCRSVHRGIAGLFGTGWDAYLVGLAAVLHYADHVEADLQDRHGVLANKWVVETATRKVGEQGIKRLLLTCKDLYGALRAIHEQAPELDPGPMLRERLGWSSWSEVIGKFDLAPPNRENLGQWLEVIDSWVHGTARLLASLRGATLEELVKTEAMLAGHLRARTAPEPAPTAPAAPADYPKLLPGSERKRQTRLGWWARFQLAHGFWPAAARLCVAVAVVGGVMSVGGALTRPTLLLYNGLARDVRVTIDGRMHPLSSGERVEIDAPDRQRFQVTAETTEGQPIERFEADLDYTHRIFVYNVAAASPLVEWTAVYGNATAPAPRKLGTPRWIGTGARDVLSEPPRSISTKSGSASREVLSGFGAEPPRQLLGLVPDPPAARQLVLTRARWDLPSSLNTLMWLELAAQFPEFKPLLRQLLQERPQDIVLRRLEQDLATDAERPQVCATHQAMAERAPDNGDLQYLTLRCRPEGEQRIDLLLAASQRWPKSGWLNYFTGNTLARLQRWSEADPLLEAAMRYLPAMRAETAITLARIRRFSQNPGPNDLRKLAAGSPELTELLKLELRTLPDAALGREARAYFALQQGRLAEVSSLTAAESDYGTAARLWRLQAASDGATEVMIRRALALAPKVGLDADTIFAAYALAARYNADTAPFDQHLDELGERDRQAIRDFFHELRQGRNASEAERHLFGLAPDMLGRAYGLGVVYLGAKAPPQWRAHVKRLLFASERPYLGD